MCFKLHKDHANHELVLDVVRDVGVFVLGTFSGCSCCSFSLRGIEIDISCGKSAGERRIEIFARSLDYYEMGDDFKFTLNEALLLPIAEEVARQVENEDQRGPLKIIFIRNRK